MNPDTETRWRTARTLIDVGAAAADFYEGSLEGHPNHLAAPPVDDTIRYALADLNRAGFVVVGYSIGEPGTRRASVQGFCDTLTLDWLATSLSTTRHQVIATTTARYGWMWPIDHLNAGIPIARDGHLLTGFAGQGIHVDDVARNLFGGLLSPSATHALADAWNVTIFDPHWGPNDLWAEITTVADPEQIQLRRRQGDLTAA